MKRESLRADSALRLLGEVASVLTALVLAAQTSGCASVKSALTSHAAEREFSIEDRWVRSTTKKEFIGYHRVHRMSPLILDTMVIQGNAIDGVVAYNRENGAELWRLDIPNGVEGGAQAAHGHLYFGASDGNFYCVQASDGKVLWTFPLRSETLAPPTVDNGVVYVENGTDVVFALDEVSGKQVWTYNRQTTGNFSIRANTRPTVSGDNVYVGFSDGFIVSLKRKDGSLDWERKIGKAVRFRDVDATPVIDGGDLFVASFDGTLYSLKADTGAVNWQLDEGAYVPVTLGTDHFTDRLYYSTVNGKILTLDRQTGHVKSTIAVRKGIATQVVFYRNLIVYGESDGALVVADPESGAQMGRFAPGFGVMAKPTIIEATGETYMMSSGANLFALKLGYHRPGDRLPWQL
jgi:outer membrane protein assembly factor BamB